MDDAAIVALFWARDERAIPAAAEKYGAYCAGIAGSILPDRRDAEECVSDTYLRAWSAMPPHRPAMLAVFLGRITRNLALNRLRSAAAQKRGGGGAEAVFEELQHIVSDRDTPRDSSGPPGAGGRYQRLSRRPPGDQAPHFCLPLLVF